MGGEVERVFRAEYPQVVATLVRVLGDIAAAEDAVQDAFVVASERWPRDGVPPNPAGWLVTTARRRAIDRHRRATRERELVAAYEPGNEPHPVPDDLLRLIFTCCHPALRTEHRIALTLRLLGGLTEAEIAHSFLVSEAAMAKRLVRARHKIKAAGIPYRIPAATDLPGRLRPVLAVLSLIYNTGADDPGRADLRAEAIHLARVLAALLPGEPEADGLLALLLLAEARVPARWNGGEPVLLADQDRTRWDQALIAEGHRLVRACVRRDRPGPYQVQAAIQAVHCAAGTFAETDWAQIVTLYDHLLALTPTPVVALNRAIAVGELLGPDHALTELDRLADDLDGYHLWHAARATFLRRRGDPAAGAAYARAVELAPADHDRRLLRRQAEGWLGATGA